MGYIFAPERFICMVTYIFFLNFLSLHRNENNKVGFVKFSTPDFVENLPSTYLLVNFKLFSSYSQLC